VLSRERWPDKGDLILHALSLPKLSGVVEALCCTSRGNEVLPIFFFWKLISNIEQMSENAMRPQSPLWPSPSPPPSSPLPGRALENPYFMGVHQAKMPGYTESKPPEAFMDTRNALFPDDAGRDDPNIIQPAYSYPDVPAPKGCRRRKRIRPLPDNAKPMRLPSRIATQLDKEEAEAAQREMEEASEEEALDPEQSEESSIRTEQRKRKSGNQGARNQRRLAKKRQLENNSTFEVGETVEENCNVYK
jgi:hypothetical protein